MTDVVPLDRHELFEDVRLIEQRLRRAGRHTAFRVMRRACRAGYLDVLVRQRVDQQPQRRAEKRFLDEHDVALREPCIGDVRHVVDFVEIRGIRRLIVENHDADASGTARDGRHRLRLEIDNDLRQAELFCFICHLFFLL